MGESYTAICSGCGHRFKASEGGGFLFELLHCARCGAEKSIPHESLGDCFKGYIKGLGIPFAGATMGRDRRIGATYQGPIVSEEEFHAAVEKAAGMCECGGWFRLNAPPRCPKCRSARFRCDPEGEYVCYD